MNMEGGSHDRVPVFSHGTITYSTEQFKKNYVIVLWSHIFEPSNLWLK